MSGIPQNTDLPQQRPIEEPAAEPQAEPNSSQPGWWQAIREAANDPEWPPLPTMGAEAAPDQNQGRPVRIRPRGIDKPQPEHQAPQSAMPAPQAQNLPPQQKLVHFHCPGCLTVLNVSQHQVNQIVQCPGCGSQVCPPRLASF